MSSSSLWALLAFVLGAAAVAWFLPSATSSELRLLEAEPRAGAAVLRIQKGHPGLTVWVNGCAFIAAPGANAVVMPGPYLIPGDNVIRARLSGNGAADIELRQGKSELWTARLSNEDPEQRGTFVQGHTYEPAWHRSATVAAMDDATRAELTRQVSALQSSFAANDTDALMRALWIPISETLWSGGRPQTLEQIRGFYQVDGARPLDLDTLEFSLDGDGHFIKVSRPDGSPLLQSSHLTIGVAFGLLDGRWTIVL